MEKLISEFSSGLFFWQTIIFVTLIFLLRKYAWKPILDTVNEREKSIRDSLNLAKEAKKEMENIQAENKKILQEARVESDWRDYWGSSDHLQADVAELGPENFTREILYICNSRGLMSYLEAREQFERRVLETDEYYNGIINVRVGSSKILKEALQNLKAI